MKICPHCAEEVQDAAHKCKHCQSKIVEIIQEKPNTNSSPFMSPKELWEMKGFRIMLLTFYFMAVFSAWASAPFWGLLLIILPIWLIQDENKPSTWKERLKNWKRHKLRSGISAFMIFMSLILIVSTVSQDVQQEKQMNAPEPQIEILSGGGNVGDQTTYTITFNVVDADEVLVEGESQPLSDSGSYSVEVKLTEPVTTVRVDASNEFKSTFDHIDVTRDMTPEEVVVAEEERLREEERTRAVIQEKLAELLDATERLRSFDGSVLLTSKEGIWAELLYFEVQIESVKGLDSYDDPELNKAVADHEQLLSSVQQREFPLMRQYYAQLLDEKYLEEGIDGDAWVAGSANDTLVLTGSFFLSNESIMTIQETIKDTVEQLRFDRVEYRWYEYDDTPEVIQIDSPADEDLLPI
jgi:hypothetical protein